MLCANTSLLLPWDVWLHCRLFAFYRVFNGQPRRRLRSWVRNSRIMWPKGITPSWQVGHFFLSIFLVVKSHLSASGSCGNIKCSMITLHPLRFQSVMTRLRKQRSNDRAAAKLLKTETFYVASEFYNQSGGTNALTDKCHACNSLTERIYDVDQLGHRWEVFSGWL